jgi:hypothetical protein
MIALTDDYLTGSWNGFFTHKTGSEEQQTEHAVNFILNMLSSGGEINGSFTDDDTRDIMNVPATFQGFVDESFISFIIQYPFFFTRNEAGELLFTENAEHPPVHYSGEFIQEESLFRGVWEIEYYVHDVSDESQVYIQSGNWEMKKQ